MRRWSILYRKGKNRKDEREIQFDRKKRWSILISKGKHEERRKRNIVCEKEGEKWFAAEYSQMNVHNHYPTVCGGNPYSWILHAASCCSLLLYAAPCGSMILLAAPCCSMLLHATPCYSMPLHAAPCCSMLLHATPYCSMLLHATPC